MNTIETYVKKIHSMLQGGGTVRISSFVDEHLAAQPLLHPLATSKQIDVNVLCYVLPRLAPEVLKTQEIFYGLSDTVFTAHGLKVCTRTWKNSTPTEARHRKRRYNPAKKQLAVYIGSLTDIEDSVTMLTALFIEAQKLKALCHDKGNELKKLISAADFRKLRKVLGERLPEFEKFITNPTDFELTLLAGTYLDFTKAVQGWWIDIAAASKAIGEQITKRPVYFVSSNAHSLINLLSGYPLKNGKMLRRKFAVFLKDNREALKRDGITQESISFYLNRKLEEADRAYFDKKLKFEQRHGLYRLKPHRTLQVDAQIFDLAKAVANPYIDKRLGISTAEKHALQHSRALILSISYPLGLTAYGILREISENVSDLRGVYIMGKSASLNASVGDIVLPSFVEDLHTGNEAYFYNILKPNTLEPFLPKRSILADQKAVTVRGTFLQNERQLKQSMAKGYSIVEMELGPYISRIYELMNPSRYPTGETFVIHPPFRLGVGYYISDTPHKKGLTLGYKGLGLESMDATYALSLGILKDIIQTEYKNAKRAAG
jgi:hypothetical protein